MTKGDAVEHLLDSFPVVYYYVRLNRRLETVNAVKDKGKFVKNTPIYLKARDFSTLWLIGLLTKEDPGGCMQTQLCDLVEWKHPSERDDPYKRFGEDVLDKLEAAGYILPRDKKHPINRKSIVVELTKEGGQCLEELRMIRKDNVSRLLELVGIDDEQRREVFVNEFQRIAAAAWDSILSEAKDDKTNLA